MGHKEDMKTMDGTLYRVFRAFGREFPVYYRYSDEDGEAIPDYPDLEGSPRYTEEGRPFVLVCREDCPYGRSLEPEEVFDGECGSCRFFRQEAGFSVFGICMNDKRRGPHEMEEKL